jgi:hypothetical protein
MNQTLFFRDLTEWVDIMGSRNYFFNGASRSEYNAGLKVWG